jgi:hypothetical protein
MADNIINITINMFITTYISFNAFLRAAPEVRNDNTNPIPIITEKIIPSMIKSNDGPINLGNTHGSWLMYTEPNIIFVKGKAIADRNITNLDTLCEFIP